MKDELKKENLLQRDKLIKENIRLVYYCVNSFHITSTDQNYDDYVSAAQYGLFKAANSFDVSKNCKFATYAIRCIKNEIFMYLRKEKKYSKVSSLDETVIINTFKSDEVSLYELIADSNSDFSKDIEEKDLVIFLMEICLNKLSTFEQLVLFCHIGGKTQKEIAKKYGISQSYISRALAKCRSKIRKMAQLPFIKKQKVFFNISGENFYQISFSIANDILRNKMFSSLENNISKELTLLIDEDSISVTFLASTFSFISIADFIEDFHHFYSEFSMVPFF